MKSASRLSSGSFFAKPSLHLLLTALVGLLAYSNTFHVPFILDDEGSILKNHVLKDLDSFLSGTGYSYNPRRFLGYLTLALNYRLGGLDVTGYHIFNLAVHIISASLVYALTRLSLHTPFFRTEEPDHKGAAFTTFIPLCAALFFVAHPVQTQAVTYIVQRLASLAAMFFLLSLVCYAGARQLQERQGRPFGAKSILLYLLALTAAGCAMKTKEIAFTLPFVIVLYEFLFFRMTPLKKLLFLLPVVLTALIVPLSMIGTDRPLGELLSDITAQTRVETDIPRLDYLLTQFPVIATYIRLLFLPVNQNLDYDFPVYRTLFAAPVLLSFLLLAALFCLALFLLYRSREGARPSTLPVRHLRLISFGVLWFFITLSVESSVIPIADVIFEHRLYLPSAGAFVALATLASFLLQKIRPASLALLTGAAVAVLTATTFARNTVWGDELSLWSDVVQKSPEKPRPHYNLALALTKRGRIDEALPHALFASRKSPEESDPHNLVGSLLGNKGRYHQAIVELKEAVRLAPGLADAHVNLGDAYRLEGMTREAMEQYDIALKLTPTDADIYSKIAATHSMDKNLEKAVIFYQCAVSLNPSRPEYRLGLQRAMQGCPPARD